jgi:hypothetical protein
MTVAMVATGEAVGTTTAVVMEATSLIVEATNVVEVTILKIIIGVEAMLRTMFRTSAQTTAVAPTNRADTGPHRALDLAAALDHRCLLESVTSYHHLLSAMNGRIERPRRCLLENATSSSRIPSETRRGIERPHRCLLENGTSDSHPLNATSSRMGLAPLAAP